MMANRLLIPVTGGVGVYDPATRVLERASRSDPADLDIGQRPRSAGRRCTGSTVLEQAWSGPVVALGPQTSGVKVASSLPDFQCFSNADASSR